MPSTPSRKPAKSAKKKATQKKMAKKATAKKQTAARGDWRAATLRRVRKLIKDADPKVVEEVKWRKPSNPDGVPTWTHDGIICTGETYKDRVKLTFAKGAFVRDPAKLFNASLDGNLRRAIDLHEGDTINERAFKALIKEAVAVNQAGKK